MKVVSRNSRTRIYKSGPGWSLARLLCSRSHADDVSSRVVTQTAMAHIIIAHCWSAPSSACTPSSFPSLAADICCCYYWWSSFCPSTSSCSSWRFYYSAFCIYCMAPTSSASSSTGSMSCLGVNISCPPMALALAPMVRFLPFPLPFLPPRLYKAVSSSTLAFSNTLRKF